MTEQGSLNPQTTFVQAKSSRRRGVIVVSILGSILALCICAVVLIVFVFRNTPSVKARDAKISTELGADGHILKDTRTIPANADEIHLEFYFENPTNSSVTLEFRWYAGDQLIYSYSGAQPDRYVAAYVELDPNQGLPAGDYHVEVWFGNTMILSEPFVVE